MRYWGTVTGFLCFNWVAMAAGAAPEYRAMFVETPPTIDGRLDEPAWFESPSVGEFTFTWWKSGPREPTVAKLLWDDQNLYVAHVCTDAHITARATERDGEIAKDDCFEVMLAPDPDRPRVYFNLEWNVIGGLIDNHRPHGPDKPKAPKWDAEDVRIAGRFQGTLNDDSDEDRFWLVEVAIPLKNFAGVAKQVPPAPGSHWNFNLNRHGGDTNPQYSQWSPADTPQPTFHTPDRFGRLVFARKSREK